MAATKPAGAGRGALPAELTSFVGRRRELKETRRLLASSRMLTLTGVGGVGKTRLALRMAAEVRRTFPGGVWFVELAAVHDPQLVPHTVANTLELRQVSADPAADLAAYLEGQQLLVVLDNCEHLTDACAVLASKLLAAAPGLRILATSRHVLGVEGEQILSVPPLSTPDSEVPAGDATHYESVTLFLERASAVAPGFEITDGNRTAVVELCRTLDGIPLAIELAAVWLRILSPAQVLDRLEDRFRLLTSGRPAAPARQQALDATVGWSYDLCSPAEQLMWARLSVFAGGFDLDAAEYVCSNHAIDRDEVLGLVANLVNKSIIVRHQATQHSTAWYHMLETIRQYGVERLTDAEQVRDLQVRHRDHYRTVAAQFAAEGFGPHQADWFMRLRRESGNIRASLEFCLGDPREASAAFDIAAPIWNFWFAGFLQGGLPLPDPGTRPRDRADGGQGVRTLGRQLPGHVRRRLRAERLDARRVRRDRGGPGRSAAAGPHQGVPGAGHALPGRHPRRHRAAGAGSPGVPGARERARRVRHLDPAHGVHVLPGGPEGRHVQPAGTGACGATRRPLVDGLRAVGGRYRAVASRRLRPGDQLVASVRAAVPADARLDRHQLRSAGAVVVRCVRRAR